MFGFKFKLLIILLVLKSFSENVRMFLLLLPNNCPLFFSSGRKELNFEEIGKF